MKQLFIDASRGWAGDMLCAALLELFEDREEKLRALNALGIPGVSFALSDAESYAITGSRLSVVIHGKEEGAHDHHDHHDHHHHEHRGLNEIFAIVDALPLSDALREDVKAVYRSIAEAEAKVHGSEPGLVHFHELGAMDAVADITAACLLIRALGVDRVIVSPVCTGFGSVRTAHGMLPVPAPATARLLESLPSYAGVIEGELCTPTGVALARHFAASFEQQPPMRVQREGYGLGKKDFGQLSCVRVLLGEDEERMIELCCNVDDMSPEAVGFALEELLRAGAADAWYEPIGMKKTRPGLLISCLCREEKRDEMLRLLFRHTSSIGVRETLCRRYVLRRGEEIVESAYGAVRVKRSEGYGVERRKAEFDDLARIARERELSLKELEAVLHDA